jgi:hypothetical protein
MKQKTVIDCVDFWFTSGRADDGRRVEWCIYTTKLERILAEISKN